MSNIIAIVGRPNVGKSTLFNRLVEGREAIMDNQSGVTRDRHYGVGEWTGHPFTVIDTGGFVEGSEDVFETAIRRQVMQALNEATVIVFMVDCISGPTPGDDDFARVLRRVKKPVIVAANKADTGKKAMQAAEFYTLGFEGEVFTVSSANGSGTGELLDEVVKHFKPSGDDNDALSALPKITVVGRPNVGKSSFVNMITGEERSIVTDVAGTTRDAINIRYKMFGNDFMIIDTAGIRRKAKVKEDIEFYSVMRAIRALQHCNVAIVIADAEQGLEAQDINLIRLALSHKKSVVLMVNKWDLVETKTHTEAEVLRKRIKEKLGAMDFVPVIFSSVLHKKRVYKVIETAVRAYEDRYKKIPTSQLNDVLLKAIDRHPPPAHRGKHIKIKYVTQLPTQSPAFAFFCNMPQHIKNPYHRFLENTIRENFGFAGVPVKIIMRSK